jgi:hypothetical protein
LRVHERDLTVDDGKDLGLFDGVITVDVLADAVLTRPQALRLIQNIGGLTKPGGFGMHYTQTGAILSDSDYQSAGFDVTRPPKPEIPIFYPKEDLVLLAKR